MTASGPKREFANSSFRRQNGITGVLTGSPEAVVGLIEVDSDKLMQHNAFAIRSVKARLRSVLESGGDAERAQFKLRKLEFIFEKKAWIVRRTSQAL